MNATLSHLPEYKQAQLREITGIIVKAVDPEKVILFGSHATGRWVEHRYAESGITYEYISDYDILVITRSGETRKDYEIQDLIENRCVYKTPVTVITHDIDFINKMQWGNLLELSTIIARAAPGPSAWLFIWRGSSGSWWWR